MGWWRSLRLRRLERRLARIMADPAQRNKIVVLPPDPPCDHLDEVTIPNLFLGVGTVTVCAYCSRVLEQA